MNEELNKVLGIRYIKLHFTLEFPEDCILPMTKTSALRGGIGEMLLSSCCIRNRECDTCDFKDDCIVQNCMYSRFKKRPAFVTSNDSVGYVVECENYEEEFAAGEQLQFNLLLFGRNIVYFSTYLQAVSMLGINGIGKSGAQFRIAKVTNSKGVDILDGSRIEMENFEILTIRDYVCYRRSQIQKPVTGIRFKTPVTLKVKGEFLQEFDTEAIVKAIQRRLYMLACFEGIDGEAFYEQSFEAPELLEQKIQDIRVRRYSTRKESAMYLQGIKGNLKISPVATQEEFLSLLLAGELIHIGKNTSFGFGRYNIN